LRLTDETKRDATIRYALTIRSTSEAQQTSQKHVRETNSIKVNIKLQKKI
jgi:hypothetical protein